MFHDILWLDFETRSATDLIAHGAYRYRDDPQHRILCAGWALGNGPTESAIIPPSGVLPLKLRNMLADKRLQIRAHNAAFDRLQLKGDAPPIERWYCTMAQARAMAMPGSLENLGRAMGTPAKYRKSATGTNLIKELTMPRKDGTFNDDPRLMAEFARYCGQDIQAMRHASQTLVEMRPEDLRVYHASERVNDRGLPIDVELCRLAVQYAAAEKIEAEAAVLELSAGALKKVQGKKLTDWVYARLDPILRKHMDVYRTKVIDVQDKGGGAAEKPGGRNRNQSGPDSITVKTRSLAADVRATLLAIAEEEPDAIDPIVVQVIEAAEAGSMMSTAKFGTMLNRVSSDGRLRGAFTFNGAYQTNRWTSTGAQVHNFPRLVAPDPEAVLHLMRRGMPLPGVLRTLKSMLRPAIAPKGGKVIVRGDWNAIEARGLPWLVNSPAATAYMAAFSDTTRDVYIEQAIAAGLGPQRQPGKVVVLALGYGGAEGALAATGRSYDIYIPEPERVVQRWRNANPWVSDKRTGWWASLARCAMQAMHNPGKPYRAGRVVLQKVGDTLTMELPSGRLLHYPMPEIVDGKFGPEIAYLKAAWKPKADAKKWPTARLWHGVFAENADQAACADLLRETLVRCEDEGIEVIGHVHDEVITEEPASKAKAAGKKLQRCMLVAPKWAAGFPLKVEVDVSPRFRK